ncbi:MAG: hypothetical protein R3E93_09735 [Thiothrix sp.]
MPISSKPTAADVVLLEAIKRNAFLLPSGLADLLDDLIAKIVTRKLSPPVSPAPGHNLPDLP